MCKKTETRRCSVVREKKDELEKRFLEENSKKKMHVICFQYRFSQNELSHRVTSADVLRLFWIIVL